jgi:gliding motility-associated-like protein
MKDTLHTIPVFIALKSNKNNAYLLCKVGFVIFFLCIIQYNSKAQPPCKEKDEFNIKPPVCNGSKALLEGSDPSNVNNSYRFIWEVSNGNCGTNNFKVIIGATGRDYSVPMNDDVENCYRRVAIANSGNCRITSEPKKVNKSFDKITLPVINITQPTCLVPTGSFRIIEPETAISFNVDGDTHPATTDYFDKLQPKKYKISVNYAAGCTSPIVEVTINAPPVGPKGSITPVKASICEGESTVLTTNGGTSYQWYKNGALIRSANQSTYTATSGGRYNVIIFKDGCSASSSNEVEITENKPPSVSISFLSAIICFGRSQTLTASEGTSYQWTKDGTPILNATNKTYTATEPGRYNVIVSNGTCQATSPSSVLLTPGILPMGNITPANPNICKGETVQLSAPALNVAYQWFKDGVVINGATNAKYAATQEGQYSVEFTSLLGCKGNASTKVSVTDLTSETITPASGTICTGGSLTLTASGGATYQWYRNGKAINRATSSTYIVTEEGTYTTDIISGNCSVKASNTVSVKQVTTAVGSISTSSDFLCSGAEAILTATGGASYQWYKDGSKINGATSAIFKTSKPGAYTADIINGACIGKASNTIILNTANTLSGNIKPATVTICENTGATLVVNGGVTYQWYKDGFEISGATKASLAVKEEGTYTADIISADGCKAKASNESIVKVAPIMSGIITPSTASLCPGSSVSLTATGGMYYQWYKDGNKISNATTATITVKDAGTYEVEVINGNCSARATNKAVVSLLNDLKGNITPASAIICSGGAVQLNASGGVTYQWYKNGVPINSATSAKYNATEIGNYTADIINGSCKVRAMNEAKVSFGTIISGSISPSTLSLCGSRPSTLTASGGNAYQWYKNDIAIIGAKSEIYEVTTAGVYSVVVFNGTCSGPASNKVNVNLRSPITFTNKVIQPSCAIPSGQVIIENTSGGSSAGYLYSKDNGITFQNSNKFEGLPAGDYQLVVKDNATCTSDPVLVTLKQSANTMNAFAGTSDIACGQANGSATITATGGSLPYTFSLNGATPQSGNVFQNLSAGTYKVVIKDAAGCTKDINFTIKQINSTLSATGAIKNPSCGQQEGSVVITPRGGSPDYQFSLDRGAFQGNNSYNNIAIGNHTVTVKDKAGCTVDVAFEIKASGIAPNLMISNPPSICAGNTANLKAASITIGSEAGLTLTYWIDAAATIAVPNPEAVTAGSYYIKAANQAGCFITKKIIISLLNVSQGNITPASSPVACSGSSIRLTATSGDAYQWFRNDQPIPGAIAASYTVIDDGIYSVAITNDRCSSRASNTVAIRFQECTSTTETRVFVPTAFTPNSNGANDYLQPYFTNIKELLHFKVYNRWGQAVYQTNIIGLGWDGKIKGISQPADTYTWILECRDFDGKLIKQNGRSLLIR